MNTNMSAAVEHKLLALCDSPLLEAVQETSEELEVTLDTAIVKIPDNGYSVDVSSKSADATSVMSDPDRSIDPSSGEPISFYRSAEFQYLSARVHSLSPEDGRFNIQYKDVDTELLE